MNRRIIDLGEIVLFMKAHKEKQVDNHPIESQRSVVFANQ